MLDKLRRHAEGWGIKIAFAIIIIVFVFYFGMGNFSEHKEPVLAYVGGEAISANEFQKAYEEAVTAMRRQNPGASAESLNTPEFKQAVLSQLVNTKLVLVAAKKMGITVSPAELRSIISSVPAFQGANGAFDAGVYKNMLAQNHITPARFEAELKSNQIIQKLQGYTALASMVGEPEAKGLFQWAREDVRIDTITFPIKTYADQVKPSDAQLNAYYEQHKGLFKQPARVRLAYLPISVSDLAAAQKVSDDDVKQQYEASADTYKHPEQIHARHILLLVPPSATQAVVDKTLAQAKDIQAQLKKGASFQTLAQKYSQDPGSAHKGGELPWFAQGSMVKPFEDAALALKPGQISAPVRTQYGWHIIQLEGTRPAGMVPLDEAAPEIRKRLAEERAGEKISEILDKSMDQIAAGVKLDKIAQGLGLQVKQSDMLDTRQVQSLFGLKKEAADTLFALADGACAQTPLAMEPARGYLLAQKIQGMPESELPLDKVKDKVIAGVKRDEGRKMAVAKAKAVLAELQNPASQEKAISNYKPDFKTSAPLDRQSAIAQFGGNPQLLQDVFAAADKSWLKQPYELADAVLLARLNERIPAPEDLWQQEKGAWLGQGAAAFRQELFDAMLKNLRATTKIEIVRKDLLN